jgi:hypothetical protein
MPYQELKKFQLTSEFNEVFAKQKFGWKKLQVSGISKSLLVASRRDRGIAASVREANSEELIWSPSI